MSTEEEQPQVPEQTFREFMNSLRVQPYQRDMVNSLYGLPVRIVEDPFDPRVGYILNEEELRKPMFLLDEGPVFEPPAVPRFWWQRFFALFAD